MFEIVMNAIYNINYRINYDDDKMSHSFGKKHTHTFFVFSFSVLFVICSFDWLKSINRDLKSHTHAYNWQQKKWRKWIENKATSFLLEIYFLFLLPESNIWRDSREWKKRRENKWKRRTASRQKLTMTFSRQEHRSGMKNEIGREQQIYKYKRRTKYKILLKWQ